MDKIAIAGKGYLGLVVGVCFAEVGHHVIYTDIDLNELMRTETEYTRIYEADLLHLLRKNYDVGRVEYLEDDKRVYRDTGIVFIGEESSELPDGTVDLSNLTELVRKLAGAVSKDCLVVINSTIPVGASDQLEQFVKDIQENDIRIEFASNPLFCTKGSAVHTTLKADRVVIGTNSKWAEGILRKVYEPFQLPIVSVSRRAAEMIKYAINSFLAVKISYINEMANVCEALGVDIEEVTKGIASDIRIGDKYINAGIGFGGSGFTSDTRALLGIAHKFGYEIKTVKAAIEANHIQKLSLYRKAGKKLITFHEMKVAVLGLTYKKGSIDCSYAPSIDNIELLLKNGANIFAYDPAGINEFKKIFPEGMIGNGTITYTDNILDALFDAEACFIFTEWGKIKSIQPDMYRKLMKTPFVFDGRNLYRVEEMQREGVEYYSVGRKKTKKVIRLPVSNLS